MTSQNQVGKTTYALRSLLGIEALSLLTSIHHVDQLGPSFIVPAVLLMGLAPLLIWWYLRKGSNAARLSYATLAALIILGFGIQDGFWNHTVKMIVFFLRGADRAKMSGMPFPPVGSVFHEVTGVAASIATILALYFGYQFITRTRRLQPSTHGLGKVRNDQFTGR